MSEKQLNAEKKKEKEKKADEELENLIKNKDKLPF